MLFQILHIRSMAKDIKENPGKFAGGQASELAIGLLIIPIIIIVLGLALFFILAFTSLLGGPYLLFKILFFIAFFISIGIGFVMYGAISLINRTTRNAVNRTVETISIKPDAVE